MEVKEAERIVIAKPIASRPTCSSLRSFSNFLASAINVSPSNACSETTITAIRPKTVRFKPTVNRTPVEVISSQAELSGAAVSFSSDKVLKSDTKSMVVYKPLAKLVSKRTVCLLTNLGNSNVSHQQEVDQIVVSVQPPNQAKHHIRSNLGSNLHTKFPSQSEREKTIDSSKTASENLENDVKSMAPASHVHGGTRPSYDGYNWRKYGQKQVKGSKYPRSYYKCTRPNCPVKKKVERSLDGQIAEIVYEGEHNHSKSPPPKCNTLGAQRQGFISDTTGQDTSNPLWSNQLTERNEGSDSGIEHQNEVGLFAQSTCAGKAPLFYNPVTVGALNTVTASVPDNSSGLRGDCEEGNKALEAEDGAPKSKVRKNENKSNKAGISEEGVQEPCIAVQSSTDLGIIGDGFHWRKYGQKVVKGNSYPRSYYRCTSLECNVRKYVERASDNPRAFITTYEGKHNHDMAIKNTNLVASETDSHAANSKAKQRLV